MFKVNILLVSLVVFSAFVVPGDAGGKHKSALPTKKPANDADLGNLVKSVEQELKRVAGELADVKKALPAGHDALVAHIKSEIGDVEFDISGKGLAPKTHKKAGTHVDGLIVIVNELKPGVNHAPVFAKLDAQVHSFDEETDQVLKALDQLATAGHSETPALKAKVKKAHKDVLHLQLDLAKLLEHGGSVSKTAAPELPAESEIHDVREEVAAEQSEQGDLPGGAPGGDEPAPADGEDAPGGIPGGSK